MQSDKVKRGVWKHTVSILVLGLFALLAFGSMGSSPPQRVGPSRMELWESQERMIDLPSDVAGTVLYHGEETKYTVAAGGSVRIPEIRRDEEEAVSVRDSAGTVYHAIRYVIITPSGGVEYGFFVEDPSIAWAPEFVTSPEDFRIQQNAQGGITIRSYIGMRRRVVIPETISGITVTAIGNNAFSKAGITSVVIPNTVTEIGVRAFEKNELSIVTIPDSVTDIGSIAFSGNRITSLTLGNNIRLIESSAFSNNKLEEVNFPASLTSIGSGSFEKNPITAIVIPPGLTNFRNAFGDGWNDSDIPNITIAANTEERNIDQFGSDFVNFWKSQNRQGGLYTRNGQIWSFTPDAGAGIADRSAYETRRNPENMNRAAYREITASEFSHSMVSGTLSAGSKAAFRATF